MTLVFHLHSRFFSTLVFFFFIDLAGSYYFLFPLFSSVVYFHECVIPLKLQNKSDSHFGWSVNKRLVVKFPVWGLLFQNRNTDGEVNGWSKFLLFLHFKYLAGLLAFRYVCQLSLCTLLVFFFMRHSHK
jgi:hypothetical protein